MALAHKSTTAATVQKHQMLIDGQMVDSATGETITIEAPSIREIFATVPRGNGEDVNRAVAAASKALPAWSKIGQSLVEV